MSRRLFKVQLNLDDMAADLIRWRSDSDRADWLTGFTIGSHGHGAAAGDSPAMQAGAAFGLRCHASAVAFSATQTSRGLASAEARRAKTGTAIPDGGSNRSEPEPNRIRTESEPEPEPEPEPDPNLSSIQYPIASNEDPGTTPVRQRPPQEELFRPDQPAPPPIKMAKTFGDFQATHGRIHVGREEREAWVATFRTYEWEPMDHAYRECVKTLTNHKHRVLLSMVTKFLDDHYDVIPEEAQA